MYNAGDRKDIRRAEKASRITEANNREALAAIMSTIPGRAWMYDKLQFAGVFTDTFTSDPYQMYFMKGQRNFGLMMLSDIMQHCSDYYIQMMREANERRNRDDRSTDDNDAGSDDNASGRGPAEPGFNWDPARPAVATEYNLDRADD